MRENAGRKNIRTSIYNSISPFILLNFDWFSDNVHYKLGQASKLYVHKCIVLVVCSRKNNAYQILFSYIS